MAETTRGLSTGNDGFKKLVEHIMMNKMQFVLWLLRLLTVILVLGYFIRLFGNPYSLYFTALMSNVGINALRLCQRLPQVSFTKQFLDELLMEDSFHYLLYAAIFFSIPPVTLVLQPIFLFSLLHLASYSLVLLDKLGQNSWWGARIFISILEFQARNLLKLIAFTEIFLMPFTVILIFLGRASLLTPCFYYQFLCLRYLSRRNPYTKNMFHELRGLLQNCSSDPRVPYIVRALLLKIISVTCRLEPAPLLRQE